MAEQLHGPTQSRRLSSPAVLEQVWQPAWQRPRRLFEPERPHLRSIPEDADVPSQYASNTTTLYDQYDDWVPLRSPKSREHIDGSYRFASSPSRRQSRLWASNVYPPKYSRRDSRFSSVSRVSAMSRLSKRFTRPLSFNGSIWLKNPDDFVLQFDVKDPVDQPEPQSFDPTRHVWSRKRKKNLIYLVSLAAMFSPLSSNIYFPALPAISTALNTSIGLISLSITVYMIAQGIAPSFWGPLADAYGRRPIFLSTLLVYLGANIALALPGNYAVLMVFRAIQAVGSASTISIGAGVIGDIAEADERGGFMGLFGGIRMFGQAIGPVFGGALSQYLGFRSIFYFLAGLSAAVIILLYLFLPETQRKIAGDGTRRLYGIYRPLIGAPKGEDIPKDQRFKPGKLSFGILFESFKLLAEKDVAVSLLFGGIIYTVWSMITSSTASLFKEEYALNQVLIGLAFLPNGLGCVLGSLITGKFMDRDYKQEAERFRLRNKLDPDTKLKQQDFPEFPIEYARLKRVYLLSSVFAVATGVYGFSVEWIIPIPLVLQFITAFTATAIFNINSTLMIDLYPAKPASATAINNLVRCSLGGVGVGLVESSISAIDEAETFLVLAVISAVAISLVYIELRYGMGWRIRRLNRQASADI